MNRSVISLIALFALAALTSGCISFGGGQAPPQKELVNTDFVGEHSVRYMLEKSEKVTVPKNASGSAAVAAATNNEDSEETETIQFYNLYVEVCDIGANDEENNCQNSKVLERIVRHSGSKDHRRQVTDMFWNTSDTLFISYLAPRPSVKSCQVTDSNSMTCSDQSNINSLLNETEVNKTEVGKSSDDSEE